jgi:pimeloyl-ACP methyl ester carboxylesterase
MAAKGLKRPVLVGWSMGGRVIRQYLINYGDAEIAGVNFVASQVIEEPRFRGPGAPKALPDQLTLAEEIDHAIAFLDGCFSKKPSEAAFRRALGYNVRVPAAVRRAIAGWSTAAPLTIEALRKVRVPVLITHGRQDSVVLPAAAEMTAAAIKHARLSCFDDCGHSPFAEDAARFNDELLAFVKSTPRP